MSASSVTGGTYGDAASITLRAGDFEALVLPSLGAHLVALRDLRQGLHLLREPLGPDSPDLSSYRAHPVPYGMPLLFPPNRIADGRFTFDGRTYRFPINEPTLHNHLHGFFAQAPWQVVEERAGEDARLVLRHALRECDEVFRIFPHCLTLELDYTLSTAGLRQEVRVRNDGELPLPFLLGFHTALRVPFAPRSSADDCLVAVNLGEQWELSERKLPTGRTVPKDAMAEAIAQGGGDPFAHPIDALFSAAPTGGFGECRITDRRLGQRVVYQTDPAYRTWMLWNDDARGGFFCAEPMTCLVNAPNLDLPWDVSGMLALAPGEIWSATSRFFVEPSGAK